MSVTNSVSVDKWLVDRMGSMPGVADQFIEETGGGSHAQFAAWLRNIPGMMDQFAIAAANPDATGGMLDASGQNVVYKTYDDEFDAGNLVLAALAAGVGGLAATGAGIGGAAASGAV